VNTEKTEVAVTKPADPASQTIAMIERLATDPNCDVSKLDKLLGMQERILARNAEADFNAAMTRAQSEMTRISTDATNPDTHSKYATYGKLDKVLRPIYVKHGFALSFDEAPPVTPGNVHVLCHVSHQGGHTRIYSKELPADGKGAKGGNVMTLTHAAGAAMTYAMRYLLKGIFNVAIGEDDNDGNTTLPTLTETQAADLLALLTETNADVGQFKKWAKVKDLSQILAKNFDYVCKEVRARARDRQR